MSLPRVTFVIPFIRTDFILPCLETLYKYTDNNDFRVITIDQSVNGVPEVQKYSHLYIKSYRALGFAKAMNTGIRLSDTEYVCCCNDDIRFMHSSWLPEVLQEFNDKPDVFAVNPMSPKEPGWGYGYPTNYDKEYIELLPYKESYTEEDYQFLLKGDFSSLEPTLPKTFPRQMSGVVDGIATWCTTYRMDIMKSENMMFDERFWPSCGEDYDQGGRAYSPIWGSKRWRMIGTMKSWVWHHWSKTKDFLGELPQTKIKPNWNNLGDLWPKGFDLWAISQELDANGNRIPYVRVPEVYVDPL